MEHNYEAMAAAYMNGPMGAQILENQLYVAIDTGDLDALQDAIADGADINMQFSEVPEEAYGLTPLCLAVKKRSIPIITFLLSQPDIDVNKQTASIAHGPTAYRSGYTPLHFAAILLNIPIIQLLFARPDIQVNAKNTYGNTPLQIAIEYHGITNNSFLRVTNVVRAFLERPDIDVTTQNSIGVTVLSMFARNIPKHTTPEQNAVVTELLQLMFAKGADMHLVNYGISLYDTVKNYPGINAHVKAMFEAEHQRREAEKARRRRVLNVTRSAAVLNNSTLPNNVKRHLQGFLARHNNVRPSNVARLATIKATTNPRRRRQGRMRKTLRRRRN